MCYHCGLTRKGCPPHRRHICYQATIHYRHAEPGPYVVPLSSLLRMQRGKPVEPTYEQQLTQVMAQCARLQQDRDDAYQLIGIMIDRNGGTTFIHDVELTGSPRWQIAVTRNDAHDGLILRATRPPRHTDSPDKVGGEEQQAEQHEPGGVPRMITATGGVEDE
jgi:hypothetical protein